MHSKALSPPKQDKIGEISRIICITNPSDRIIVSLCLVDKNRTALHLQAPVTTPSNFSEDIEHSAPCPGSHQRCRLLLFLSAISSTSRFWDTSIKWFNGHLWPSPLPECRPAGLPLPGTAGMGLYPHNYIYQNILLEAVIWQLTFSLCKTPLSWYHYQPQLTRALNACSPARPEPARSLGSTENHSSQQILLLSLFNLLFPDAPQNNPALRDRVRELAQLQTNNILTPEKGAGNVTGLRYQVAAPTLLEAAQYWRGS